MISPPRVAPSIRSSISPHRLAQQSINKSTNQPINQSISQVNQSISHRVSQSQNTECNPTHVIPTEKWIDLRGQDLVSELLQRYKTVESSMSVTEMINCYWQQSWHHSQCYQMVTNIVFPVPHIASTWDSSHPYKNGRNSGYPAVSKFTAASVHSTIVGLISSNPIIL